MGKKDKKGKKKGKKKDEIDDENKENEETDADALADLGITLTPIPDTSEEPPKKKKKKKKGKKGKKLSKKERERLAEEMEKVLKLQQEQERKALLAETKERVQREWAYNEIKYQSDKEEQLEREYQMLITYYKIEEVRKKWAEFMKFERQEAEWNQYMKCDGLPDPASFAQMNTYLFLWTGDESTNNIEAALKKTDEVLQLLGTLDELIDDPPPNVTRSCITEWKKIRNHVRLEQQKHLDTATYKLLRQIERDMEPIDLTTSKYVSVSQHFTLYLWAEMIMPIPSSRATEVKQPLTVDFPDVGVSVLLPASLADVFMAIRALWLKYDHCSDLCPTWDCPPEPEVYFKDLNEVTLDEWAAKVEIQEQRIEEEKSMKAKIKNLPKDGTTSAELLVWGSEPQKSVSDIISMREEQEEAEWRAEMKKVTAPHEVNLRKFCVLGGVLHLDLLEQPPQPKDLRKKFVITVLTDEPCLHPLHYNEKSTEPAFEENFYGEEEEVVEEEAEVEMIDPDELEEEFLKKLVLIEMKLPESVLWFEPPMAANWDPVNNYWSTEEIHDLKFNEDKQTVTFRSGRMGLMSLVAYRYCNLPYQTWEMKPDFKGPPGGVVLSITCSVVIVEFIIRDDKVCLSQLQNGPTTALQEIVGNFYKPHKLMKLMMKGGVDIFPPPDAFCYVEGAAPKHRPAEDHLYHCMAMMSTCYNFSWSRWNLLAGRRNLIIQMRESLDRKRLPNYNILHVTPLKAIIVDCTEVSQSFNEEGIEGMQFYSDLYHLVMEHGTSTAKNKIEEISFTLVETVHQLLCATRPLSFS